MKSPADIRNDIRREQEELLEKYKNGLNLEQDEQRFEAQVRNAIENNLNSITFVKSISDISKQAMSQKEREIILTTHRTKFTTALKEAGYIIKSVSVHPEQSSYTVVVNLRMYESTARKFSEQKIDSEPVKDRPMWPNWEDIDDMIRKGRILYKTSEPMLRAAGCLLEGMRRGEMSSTACNCEKCSPRCKV